MNRRRHYRIFAGDFETTVYEGQTSTEVWASALVELYTEDTKLFHSIDETFEYLFRLHDNCLVYYHNLKFDGTFIITYLLSKLNFQQALINTGTEDEPIYSWKDEEELENGTFSYCISSKGQWYNIIIKHNNRYIEIEDSLKLLPFAVKRLGEGFKTKHRKLDMDYTGYRYAGCTITEEEAAYIKNDVLVVKEALEEMYNRGHTSLTIGSCCLKEYKQLVPKWEYKAYYPNLYDFSIDPDIYKYENAGEYIKKSYRGGWCYVLPAKKNKVLYNGCTADVNSLYPSVMSSESGCVYPTGYPTFWKGDIPTYVLHSKKNGVRDYYYFVRIKCRFYLKDGYLPFIQIKGNPLYDSRENLITSDYWDKKQKRWCKIVRDIDGTLKDTKVEMVMTCVDFELFQKHYDLYELEILDGCWFHALPGIFDNYIKKYQTIKITTDSPVERQLAKLFLNNLYGKMAMSTDSSFKVCYLNEEGILKFRTQTEHNKQPGYIACGSAITSYARNFTITAAQTNYHGGNKPGFVYADTDSIHCDLPPESVRGITIHPTNFCCWKLESTWDFAIFARQKTYIEHITEENQKPIEKPYYSIKCAGMPDKCKDLFQLSLYDNILSSPKKKMTFEESIFLSTQRTIADFRVGLQVPGLLKARQIPGGTLLVEQTYTMTPSLGGRYD